MKRSSKSEKGRSDKRLSPEALAAEERDHDLDQTESDDLDESEANLPLWKQVWNALWEKRPTLSFLSFVLLYTAFTLAVYNFTFWSHYFQNLQVDTALDFVFVMSYIIIVFALSAILLSLFMVKYLTKALAIVLCLLNAPAIYFMSHYGVIIDRFMIQNVFESDTSEAFDLLTAPLVVYILFLGILPSIVITRLNITYLPFWKEALRRVLFYIWLLIVFFALIFSQYRRMSIALRDHTSAFDYLMPRGYIDSFIEYLQGHLTQKPELQTIGQDLVFKNKSDLVVVLVIGETARRANFSLYGYPRNTNPKLSQIKSLITLQNVVSCGTATAVSLPCMFSHLNKGDYLSNRINYEYFPSMLARNGVEVWYKDNNFGFCKETCRGVRSKKTNQDNNYDGVMLDGVSNFLKMSKGRPTLLVLHQNGSHGPRYFERYPKSFEIFKPVCEQSDLSRCSQEELVNAYDNTILYTDSFLDRVIGLLKASRRPSAMIYVSDHGESLGENGIYLHGFPYALAPAQQYEIPWLMWFSQDLAFTRGFNRSCFNREPSYSHDNLFHSVMGLFQAKLSLYNPKLDLFAACGSSHRRL